MEGSVVEVLPGRLFWVSAVAPPRGIRNAFYFNVDGELRYRPLAADFGPLSIAQICWYIRELERLLAAPENAAAALYHHTSTCARLRVNSALALGCFAIARLGCCAAEVARRFDAASPPLPAFRDASHGPCTHDCTLGHCLRGFEHALRARLLDLRSFDAKGHESLAQGGDLSWIVPGKLLALSTPCDPPTRRRPLSLAAYAALFKRLGVGLVIRLNRPAYAREALLGAGIRHLDLAFPDGSTPSADIINRFLAAVEAEAGAVAVHCRAGLGRTGTLIAVYLMKHYKFCGGDAIAFLRLMRPGSVLGPQQHFLVHNQRAFWRLPSARLDALPADFPAFAQRMRDSDDCAATLSRGAFKL